jgi:propanol-preferring alcohol dehydrogenase
MEYERDLFYERVLRSVTANTRSDGVEFLALARQHGIRATTVPYAMADADRALADLAAGAFGGAAVLHT